MLVSPRWPLLPRLTLGGAGLYDAHTRHQEFGRIRSTDDMQIARRYNAALFFDTLKVVWFPRKHSDVNWGDSCYWHDSSGPMLPLFQGRYGIGCDYSNDKGSFPFAQLGVRFSSVLLPRDL